MKMSTKGRYGARIMLDLAVHAVNHPVSLKDIAKRQDIPEKYLWQLISKLMSAGYVKSHRGINGGYDLARKPHEITLKDIIVTMEGPMSIVDCVEAAEMCRKSYNCVTRQIWSEISSKIYETLESISLQDMLEKYKRHSDALSYSI